jgi:hypothetical protein
VWLPSPWKRAASCCRHNVEPGMTSIVESSCHSIVYNEHRTIGTLDFARCALVWRAHGGSAAEAVACSAERGTLLNSGSSRPEAA